MVITRMSRSLLRNKPKFYQTDTEWAHQQSIIALRGIHGALFILAKLWQLMDLRGAAAIVY